MYGDNVTIVAHVTMLDTLIYIMMMKMTCGFQYCESVMVMMMMRGGCV